MGGHGTSGIFPFFSFLKEKSVSRPLCRGRVGLAKGRTSDFYLARAMGGVAFPPVLNTLHTEFPATVSSSVLTAGHVVLGSAFNSLNHESGVLRTCRVYHSI